MSTRSKSANVPTPEEAAARLAAEQKEQMAAEQAAYDQQQAEAEQAATLQQKLKDAMAGKPVEGMDMGTLLQAQMLGVMQQLVERNEAGPTPQIPFAKFKPQTPWNPSGVPYARALRRPTYLNDFRLRELTMTQEEIDKVNQLKPGKYHNRKWLVIEQDGDEHGGKLNIYIPNKEPDQRLEIAQLHAGRGLAGLLDIVLKEQNAVTLA